MNTRRLLAGLLLSLLGSLCRAESLCITTGEWPPYIGEDLPEYGPVSAIIKQAFSLEGIEVQWKFYPWARAMLVAEDSQCDGTAVWASSKERQEKFFYSVPIISNQTHFLHLKSKPLDWQTLDDLHNLLIGSTIGYFYGNEFQDATQRHDQCDPIAQ